MTQMFAKKNIQVITSEPESNQLLVNHRHLPSPKMQGENIFGAQADERFFLCLHARLQNPAERCRWVRFEGYRRSNLESSVTKGHQSNPVVKPLSTVLGTGTTAMKSDMEFRYAFGTMSNGGHFGLEYDSL